MRATVRAPDGLFTPRRATETPSLAVLFLQAQGPTDFRGANAVLTGVVPSRPSFSDSRKTNSAGVRNSLRWDDSSGLRALRHADRANYRSIRRIRTPHIGAGVATSRPF
jgi:hypothetical protein